MPDPHQPPGRISTSAEEILRRREVLGWKLGLERMRRLCTLLGMPQNRFASVHVVGTNGKTSVTRMTAALLEAHGASTGAYVSPHIVSWRERILIRGEPISEEAFTEALERTEQAAQVADRSAGEEGPVTQYELLTAAAFVAFAAARVQYGVIEAGLGGRLDATNVIPSKLTVLTSVGLDHTEWLGETLEEIAAEKVAVLRDHTTLMVGKVPPEIEPLITEVVQRRHAKLVQPSGHLYLSSHEMEPGDPSPLPGYQGRNMHLAWDAVQELLGARTDPMALPENLGRLRVRGRAQLVRGDPDEVFDAAHNPDGARALAETLPELASGRDVVCCLAVLEGKDAAGVVNGLAPACAQFVCTEIPPDRIEGSGRPGGRARPALELTALCEKAGVEAEAIAEPLQAWARARELAEQRGGVALAAGSHYLLACLWTERPAQSS
jgi:dihydrofolate synthase / folylpolyglutamate synthase